MKIKGLSIQTQQNTFVLFTLFKLTSDECKTLTKISTCKTSHNHSPNQHTLRTRRNKKTSKQPNKEKEEKAVCSSSLWQIQEGKPKLLGYASKTLPEASTRYSATELEMTVSQHESVEKFAETHRI